MKKLPAVGKFHFAPPSRFTSFHHLVGSGERPLSSVCQSRRIEEKLYFAEKLHPVLFQHDEMRSFTDNDKALVGAPRKPAKNRECTLRGVEPIPLGRNDQCGNFDAVWFIKWLTCLPVIPLVLKATRRATQHWRNLLRTNRVGG